MEKMQVRPSEGNNKLQYYRMDFLTLLFILVRLHFALIFNTRIDTSLSGII